MLIANSAPLLQGAHNPWACDFVFVCYAKILEFNEMSQIHSK